MTSVTKCQGCGFLHRFYCAELNFASKDWLNVIISLCRKKPELVRSPMIPLPMPKKLRFNITPEIKNDIEKAKQNLNMYVKSTQKSARW